MPSASRLSFNIAEDLQIVTNFASCKDNNLSAIDSTYFSATSLSNFYRETFQACFGLISTNFAISHLFVSHSLN